MQISDQTTDPIAERLKTTAELNRVVRRLRQYETESDWIGALLDAAIGFVPQAAVFAVQNETVSLRAQHRLQVPDGHSFPIAHAKAFENAIVSKDTIVALRTAGEVTEILSSPDSGDRAHVLPIFNGSRPVAILFATGKAAADLNGLELICGMASMVLERQSNSAVAVQIAPAASAQGPSGPVVREFLQRNTVTDASVRTMPKWSRMPKDQRQLHIRAQRFSRVKVAEMQLLRPEACRAGREQNNVYLFLKKEIDSARESYHTQFMTVRSMDDYLHKELVGAVADGDELKLGADYPGQLE